MADTSYALKTEEAAALMPDLECPACGADLAAADVFRSHRVCPTCGRHFSLPARERLALLTDPGGFQEINATLVSIDPLTFHDQLPYPDRLAEAQERTVLSEAVITGTAPIGGHQAVFIALDDHLVGESIGVVAGEKITLALELALARQWPLIALCAGGAARMQEGMLSLVQLAKTSAAATRLHRAGIPLISVLTHPTTGGVYAGLGNQADIILAEPGALIGWTAAAGASGLATAETLQAQGLVDAVVDRVRLRSVLATMLGMFAHRGVPRPAGPVTPPAGNPPAWEAAGHARHPDRPTALDYLQRLMPDLIELHGDRIGADDPAVVCGIGRFEGMTVAVVAQERGRDPTERERRRDGRLSPDSYRKATRLMRLAGHLEIPLLTLLDGPGPVPAIGEDHSIGIVVAQTFSLMSMLPVPIVSVTIGEGGGAAALALGVGDRVLMQEQAIYAVASPESGGAPVMRAMNRLADIGSSLVLTARECQRLGVVDVVVPEPAPAAHADPDYAALQLRAALAHAFADLSGLGSRRLLGERARKIRSLGQTTPEGRAVTWREVSELQELQRTLARSLGDLRGRWEQRNRAFPKLNLHRPDLTDLAGRLAARRHEERD